MRNQKSEKNLKPIMIEIIQLKFLITRNIL